MKVVQFKNGMFGVRKGWLFYRYADLRAGLSYFWPRTSRWFYDCQGSKEQACAYITRKNDPGTPVKCCEKV